jgi:hypothetical protein
MTTHNSLPTVIPAKAGTHLWTKRTIWFPAFAGMTVCAERTRP